MFCASYKWATGLGRREKRGAAHDNKARLTNSWVEVSWLLVRCNEESEELWFSKWMKWALCDSCCAPPLSVEPAGGSPSRAAAGLCLNIIHNTRRTHQPQTAYVFKSINYFVILQSCSNFPATPVIVNSFALFSLYNLQVYWLPGMLLSTWGAWPRHITPQ